MIASERWAKYGGCARCGAKMGEACRTKAGRAATAPHAGRGAPRFLADIARAEAGMVVEEAHHDLDPWAPPVGRGASLWTLEPLDVAATALGGSVGNARGATLLAWPFVLVGLALAGGAR